MIDASKATPELFAAIAEAQFEVENASKGSFNPHFKSRYADLAEVLNTVRPVYAAKGLCIVQVPSFDGTSVTVTTIIGHKGGGSICGQLSCVPARTDAQGVGAASTYLRRYLLAAMTGIAQEDDDGNAASAPRAPRRGNDETEAPRQERPAIEHDPAPQSLPANMAKVLDSRLTAKGMTREDLIAGFGQVTPANINAALKWITEARS